MRGNGDADMQCSRSNMRRGAINGRKKLIAWERVIAVDGQT
jgi:hypothetical protein